VGALVVAIALGVLPGPDLRPIGPVGLGPGAALAHTDLLQGSPGPAQLVGGTVDFVDLVFVAAVSDARIDLTGPDGSPVPGQMEVSDGQIVRYRMEPIDEPGRYLVSYRIRSADGDDTGAEYSFSYDPDALQPIRIGGDDVPPSGSDVGRLLRWAVVVVLVACLATWCLALILRLRRQRDELASVRGGGRS
jgi:methionine-rich copper-binding protein CopC